MRFGELASKAKNYSPTANEKNYIFSERSCVGVAKRSEDSKFFRLPLLDLLKPTPLKTKMKTQSSGLRTVLLPGFLASAMVAHAQQPPIPKMEDNATVSSTIMVKSGTCCIPATKLTVSKSTDGDMITNAAQIMKLEATNGQTIGVMVERVSDDLRGQLPQLKPAAGLIIRNVSENSAAKAAGLEAGDILLSFNGDSLVHPEQLKLLVQSVSAEKKISVTYLRKGAVQKTSLTMSVHTEQAAAPEKDAATSMLQSLLGDSDIDTKSLVADFGITDEQLGQITSGLEGLLSNGGLEGLLKQLPTDEAGKAKLMGEIEKLAAQVGKQQADSTAGDAADVTSDSPTPDAKSESIDTATVMNQVKKSLQDAGVDPKMLEELEKGLKGSMSGDTVKAKGKMIVIGPDGKITETDLSIAPAKAAE